VCIHCGCGQPSNRHGNTDAITVGDVEKAMQTAAHRKGGKGVFATAEEMRRMLRKHAGRKPAA
jgi:hypothetical protein